VVARSTRTGPAQPALARSPKFAIATSPNTPTRSPNRGPGPFTTVYVDVSCPVTD